MANPATQLKSALDTLKTTLRNRIKDYKKRLAKGDFAPRQRRELKLDAEAQRLKAQAERVKQKFREGLLRDRLKQRSGWEKAMDAVQAWRRGFILSGPATLAKLTAAAIWRGAITPAEELVGSGLRQIPGLREIAARAPRQGGGLSVRAESRALTEGFTTGMRDAWQTLRTGKSDLDALYGKRLNRPQEFIQIFGNIHGALKAPIKRAEFARSFQQQVEFYTRHGVDASDPAIQAKIGLQAYADAERSIFMQRNMFADKLNAFIRARVDPKTGHASIGQKSIETAGNVLLPIRKVPTNIVAETLEYAFGSLSGAARRWAPYSARAPNT